MADTQQSTSFLEDLLGSDWKSFAQEQARVVSGAATERLASTIKQQKKSTAPAATSGTASQPAALAAPASGFDFLAWIKSPLGMGVIGAVVLGGGYLMLRKS